MTQTKTCYVGAAAPEYLLFTRSAVAAPDGYLPDLSLVTSATFEVATPGATSPTVTWTATIVSQSASQIVLKYVFAADGSDVPVRGTYAVYPRLATAVGTYPVGGDAFEAQLRSSVNPGVASYPGVIELGEPALTGDEPAPAVVAHTFFGFFPDDGAGDVVFSAPTTLAADVRARTVVVNPGVVVDVAGFAIRARLSITNNGTIHQDGKAASGATAGARSCDPEAASCSVAGGAGGITGGGSGEASRGIFAGVQLFDLGGASSGAGGNGNTAGAAGTANSGGTVSTRVTHPFAGPDPTRVVEFDFNEFVPAVLTVGCGGGGGGGNGGGSGQGGGGGGGGGLVRLRAPTIVNNGTIRARGGAGGNATAGTNAGGGGGGGGGRIILVGSLSGDGTTDVSGGAGGTASGAGTAGAAGSSGSVHLFG